MNEKKPSFEAALEAVLESSRDETEHVTPDLLVAYHHDRLSPQRSDAVQEHLAACRRCGDLVLELVRFGEDAAGEADEKAAQVVDFQAEAEWRALRRRLAEAEPAAAVASAPLLAYALAASLLLTAGLAAWVAVLRSELDLSRRPQVNFTVVNLEPEGTTRGDPGEATVASASERFVVILNPPSFPAAVEHRVEILTADDRVLWSGRGLRPTAAGNFHLELSRRFLAPGQYRLRLSSGDELVTHFNLRIVP